jgi:hypothetical protein
MNFGRKVYTIPYHVNVFSVMIKTGRKPFNEFLI